MVAVSACMGGTRGSSVLSSTGSSSCRVATPIRSIA